MIFVFPFGASFRERRRGRREMVVFVVKLGGVSVTEADGLASLHELNVAV